MANNPVLILEGEGDKASVPELIRSVSQYSILPCSNPIIKQSISKLNKPGELEKFVMYAASRPEGDSVLIILDTDEKCAVDVVSSWRTRISSLHLEKKVGICFFVKEFEALFLSCLNRIIERYPNYGWKPEIWDLNANPETPRGAKEILSNAMARGRSYKETVDQVKFVGAVDFLVARQKCRAFRHFEAALEWLANDTESIVYPEG